MSEVVPIVTTAVRLRETALALRRKQRVTLVSTIPLLQVAADELDVAQGWKTMAETLMALIKAGEALEDIKRRYGL